MLQCVFAWLTKKPNGAIVGLIIAALLCALCFYIQSDRLDKANATIATLKEQLVERNSTIAALNAQIATAMSAQQASLDMLQSCRETQRINDEFERALSELFFDNQPDEPITESEEEKVLPSQASPVTTPKPVSQTTLSDKVNYDGLKLINDLYDTLDSYQ